jgi:hypothetical protein
LGVETDRAVGPSWPDLSVAAIRDSRRDTAHIENDGKLLPGVAQSA